MLQVATYIKYLKKGSKRELKNIFKLIKLDDKTRSKVDNIIEKLTEDNKPSTLSNINKALSFELLSSFYMNFIDDPKQVWSHCTAQKTSSDEILPNNFAPSGMGDIEIDYPEFQLMIEVSAKTSMTVEQYSDQVDGAKKHAQEMRKNDTKKPIYCLMINERTLKDNDIKDCLIDAQKEMEKQNIYFTSMTIDEFAKLGGNLAHQRNQKIKEIGYITSASLKTCFEDAANSLNNEKYIRLDKRIMQTVKDLAKNRTKELGR